MAHRPSSNWSLLLLSIASCLVIQGVLSKSDARYSYSGYRSKYSPGYYARFSTYHGPGSHHSPGHSYRKYGYKLVSSHQQHQAQEMEKTVATALARKINFNRNENTIKQSVTKPKQKFPKRIPAPLSIAKNPVQKSQPPPPPQPSPAPPVTRPPPPPPSPAPVFQALPSAPSPAPIFRELPPPPVPSPAPAPLLPQAVPAVPGLPVLSDNSVSAATPSISRPGSFIPMPVPAVPGL